MRDRLTTMTGWIARTVLCIALLAIAVPWARADDAPSDAPPPAAEATYDETQPGADDPRVRTGFDAYKAGDFKKAYDIWLPLANAGNAEAQFRIGRLFDRGEGVQSNLGIAIEYLKMAVDGDHIHAATNLGIHYDLGEGVTRDQYKAFELYLKGASQCDSTAQFNLGTLYVRTFTSKRDFALAYKWLLISQALGSDDAAKAIIALDKYANEDQRSIGRKKMQEWFMHHSCK